MRTASLWTVVVMLTAILAVGCGKKSEEPKATPQTPATTAASPAPAPSVAPNAGQATPATPGAPAPSATPAAPAAGTPAPTAAPQPFEAAVIAQSSGTEVPMGVHNDHVWLWDSVKHQTIVCTSRWLESLKRIRCGRGTMPYDTTPSAQTSGGPVPIGVGPDSAWLVDSKRQQIIMCNVQWLEDHSTVRCFATGLPLPK